MLRTVATGLAILTTGTSALSLSSQADAEISTALTTVTETSPTPQEIYDFYHSMPSYVTFWLEIFFWAVDVSRDSTIEGAFSRADLIHYIKNVDFDTNSGFAMQLLSDMDFDNSNYVDLYEYVYYFMGCPVCLRVEPRPYKGPISNPGSP